MNEHTLSVVIPAFNAERDIEAAVESAAALRPLEIVVVDDGSSDHTATLAKRLPCKLVQQSNQGASVARRTGVLSTQGDLVLLLDVDDRIIAHGMTALIAQMAKESDDWAVGGGRYFAQRPGGNHIAGPPVRPSYTTCDLILNCGSPWPPAASILHGATLRQLMRDNPGIHPRFAEDYEMLLELSRRRRIVAVDTFVALYNPTGGKSTRKALAAARGAEEVRLRFADRYGLSVAPRTSRELCSVALQRMVGDSLGRGALVQAAILTVLRTVLDPYRTMKSVASLLRRRKVGQPLNQ